MAKTNKLLNMKLKSLGETHSCKGFNKYQFMDNMVDSVVKAKPFVKWAGGKRQLLKELTKGLPKFKKYIEPMAGGGALFFELKNNGLITEAILNDYNRELMDTYNIIGGNTEAIMGELSKNKYKNEMETFYKIRQEEPTNKVEKTARFIYLNRTAYNGLYRVNSKGKFNAPFGKYKNPKILDKKNLRAVSKALKGVKLLSTDFEKAIKNAKKGDLVYFDPPYNPLSKTASFTSYTEKDFDKKEQIRLAKTFKKLDKKGCYLMLSNSFTPLIQELYKDFNIRTVYANRAINCKAGGRGKIKEVIITNYAIRPL